jgi:hypothetical protein
MKQDFVLEFTERFWTEQQAVAIVSNMADSLFRAALIWGCWAGLIYAAAKFARPNPERLPWLAVTWIVISVGEMAFVASQYLDYYNVRRALEPNPLLRRVIEARKTEGLFRFKMVVTDSVLNNLYFLQLPYHGIHSVDIPANSRPPDDYNRYFRELESHFSAATRFRRCRNTLRGAPISFFEWFVRCRGRWWFRKSVSPIPRKKCSP